ncbi:Quinoprotein glucose dehydrogenase B precursor [Chryseobacterium nakagawai]|uniref:T9SS C-terminal target domain-containing protein n=1 Tax=Chryseobacterium nakagawai TaxID=1241982 RepID=A0AAD0YSH5_CHRNA|nr:PQQ-dependent sugar dehydrogenase [Chryseobacterium nakagawai]AZA93398.1 T9SS C-terminal target domain-containing protein [Chryseobacterium nakagawai]VEH20076.1 Quinoprotein glucose dehydrogenase B precursor [Chryseobacterium nakagawai]
MKNLLFTLSIFSSLIVNAQSINLEEFATGLTSPVEITNANDSRLFVVQQNGMIKIVQPNGAINATNFLDIAPKIVYGGERGLLGLAFHPQYSTNGYFFVYYNNTAGNIVLARYSVNSTNPDIADPNSEKILLNIPKPFANHNGGSIHFAPDGKLWIVTGDGGSGGDPNNNAQNKNSLLGKMLRIDVNATDPNPYNIPSDNPFAGAGVDGADEIWAYGLRNAWKFSFDLTTGNAMIADVGQGAIEEINKMPITQGGINYGWRCYEGNSAYNTAGCPAQSSMTFPIAVYDHSGGKCSITGGYVYRGTQYPSLQGKYFFADYCSDQIGILATDNSITWTSSYSGNGFSSFGQNSQKDLFVAAVTAGKIFKITSGTLDTRENNLFQAIKIYPNPTSKEIFIDGIRDKKITLELINAEGRKLLETDHITSGKGIDISGFPPGVYFINLKTGNLKSYSQKLIIK